MSSPEIARLGHLALETPDLDGSLSYFRDAVGLEAVERSDDTVYLRAVDEFDHHSLSLTAADGPGIDHVGWQTEDRESLDGFATKLGNEGIDVEWVDADAEAGQGKAIRFEAPHGHRFELYAEMAKPDPPADRRSKLKNRVYSSSGNNPVAPNRIDHVQIWDPEAKACAEWLMDVLGLDCHEYFDNADGSRWGTFLSACRAKIDLAIIQLSGDATEPAVHHAAYKVDTAEDLFAAKDAMNERGIPTDGFGQHAISRGKFCYTRDPVSGHRIEFSAGGYLTFDPHWEPVAWNEAEVEDEGNQWIGQVDSRNAVPY